MAGGGDALRLVADADRWVFPGNRPLHILRPEYECLESLLRPALSCGYEGNRYESIAANQSRRHQAIVCRRSRDSVHLPRVYVWPLRQLLHPEHYTHLSEVS